MNKHKKVTETADIIEICFPDKWIWEVIRIVASNARYIVSK